MASLLLVSAPNARSEPGDAESQRRAIERIGSENRATVPAIETLLGIIADGETGETREAAAGVLRRWKGRPSMKVVTVSRLLDGLDLKGISRTLATIDRVFLAAWVLGRIGDERGPSKGDLGKLADFAVSSGDPRLRQGLSVYLQSFLHSRPADPTATLFDPDFHEVTRGFVSDQMAGDLIRLIARVGDPGGTPTIEGAMESEAMKVREAGCFGAARSRQPGMIDRLRSKLATEKDARLFLHAHRGAAELREIDPEEGGRRVALVEEIAFGRNGFSSPFTTHQRQLFRTEWGRLASLRNAFRKQPNPTSPPFMVRVREGVQRGGKRAPGRR
jgi:hypothetical protein